MTDKLEQVRKEVYKLKDNPYFVTAIRDVFGTHEEPVSEELEEEMENYIEAHMDWSADALRDPIKNWGKSIARHFANWQKQQTMKRAVEKRIETNFLRAYLCMYVDELGFEPGDKVKVIIIKQKD